MLIKTVVISVKAGRVCVSVGSQYETDGRTDGLGRACVSCSRAPSVWPHFSHEADSSRAVAWCVGALP